MIYEPTSTCYILNAYIPYFDEFASGNSFAIALS